MYFLMKVCLHGDMQGAVEESDATQNTSKYKYFLGK